MACWYRTFPSNINGVVTIATVRIFKSLAILATTGAAPVPVPPPIPAVMNSILVLFFRILLISSELSSAAFLATSGLEPAPNPVSPNFIFTGIGLDSKTCTSVLQITKSTPLMPLSNICLTALHPPPPIPITLIIGDSDVGNMNSNDCFSIILIFF
ncbi:MAG: hypothetical protein BWX61_01314 [Bacteroidetes bacterium ADurb.Bin035]|nr:MAG: hypothetical protein BWX61_01314 [Bacteroidetes bacterium ADurb.Bin035]